MSTIERARGRWPEILPQLGLNKDFLSKKHGPCPLCGGKDRYRFEDRNGSGSYYCHQCGPGSGMTLAMKLIDADFAGTARRIDALIGTEPRIAPIAPQTAPDGRERRLRALRQVLAEANNETIVDRYIENRGLKLIPAVLQGHPRLLYADGDSLKRFPAVVAPVVDIQGNLQSVHRTYIGPAENRKKLMPAVDTITGAAVRLFEIFDTLGIAEGIETAIAAAELSGIPTWAAISAGGLEKIAIPDDVKRVVIFADNDRNFVGQKAAFALAHRLKDYEVDVRIPPIAGTDWLDVLVERRAA